MDKRIVVLMAVLIGGACIAAVMYSWQPAEEQSFASTAPGLPPPVVAGETAEGPESSEPAVGTPEIPASEAPSDEETNAPEPEPPSGPDPRMAEADAAFGAGDYAKARQLYTAIAESGVAANRHAMAQLGRIFEEGLGGVADPDQALDWYSQAADAGDADSALYVASVYRGAGTEADEVRAARYFAIASKSGDATAIGAVDRYRSLANASYVGGRYAEAIRYYQPLAEGGDTSVMYTLGLMHEQGQGTAPNAAEARRWFRRSANSGDPRGINELASMYATGDGVGRDDRRAAELWRQAAEAGNLSAMVNLAQMYERGLGVAQSTPQAIEWNERAAAQGSGLAEENLRRLR